MIYSAKKVRRVRHYRRMDSAKLVRLIHPLQLLKRKGKRDRHALNEKFKQLKLDQQRKINIQQARPRSNAKARR